MTTDPAVQAAAEAMHDAYEARAAEVGWETQARSRVAWADVPEANKQAMYAAVAAARPIIAAETAQLRAKLDAIHRLCEPYHTEETTFVRADDILAIIDGGTS